MDITRYTLELLYRIKFFEYKELEIGYRILCILLLSFYKIK